MKLPNYVQWILIGIIVFCAFYLSILVYNTLLPEPETQEYTAEIEMQGDNMIIVTTHKVGGINADKLRVKFEHPLAIKITNKNGIVKDIFEYDPAGTHVGDDYSISGGEKGVPIYEIQVSVYYSYEDKDKRIKEEIIEYHNPNK